MLQVGRQQEKFARLYFLKETHTQTRDLMSTC
jgi:hypothetical protein